MPPPVTPLSGHLSLTAEARADGRTVLGRQSFCAPYHLSKPYWDGQTLIVQVVNPTAGILSGDTLRSDITVAAGAALLVTTPSATRIFQMDTGSAESRQRFEVQSSAWLDLLPEPLVPHFGSRFRQVTEIEAMADAEFFYGDLLLPGRIARGETWAWSRLCLDLRLRLGGELILRERFDQSGAELKALAQLAGSGDGAGFANLVIASPRLAAEEKWKTAVSALHGNGVWIGVSRLRGAAVSYSLKLITPDGDVLRRTLREVRQILAAVLPRLASEPRKL